MNNTAIRKKKHSENLTSDNNRLSLFFQYFRLPLLYLEQIRQQKRTLFPLVLDVPDHIRRAADGSLDALCEREVFLAGQTHRRHEEAGSALQRGERVVPVARRAARDVLELDAEPEQNAGGEEDPERERAAVLPEKRSVRLRAEIRVDRRRTRLGNCGVRVCCSTRRGG